MPQHPVLRTERLILRSFRLDDIPALAVAVGERDIAATTLTIPHPYTENDAREYISRHQEQFDTGQAVNFAVTLAGSGKLIGAVSLSLRSDHDRAEMGYWIDKTQWGNGYCTEAAGAVLKYAFEQLKLNRVWATFMTRNPASGRVMEKLGMRYEGCLREHVKKWDRYEDLGVYSMLRDEFSM